jgi:hypothetical protein
MEVLGRRLSSWGTTAVMALLLVVVAHASSSPGTNAPSPAGGTVTTSFGLAWVGSSSVETKSSSR